MALFGRTQVGLKDTSSRASVPNNDKAKLMYYLNCVCSVLNLDDDAEINRLRQYNRYNLTRVETDRLISLCYLLSPDVLQGKCFFHSDELCQGDSNKFYDLTVARTHLAVAGSILIGGQRRQVQSIMTFTMGWINENWASPIQAVLEERHDEIQAEQRARRRQSRSCVVM